MIERSLDGYGKAREETIMRKTIKSAMLALVIAGMSISVAQAQTAPAPSVIPVPDVIICKLAGIVDFKSNSASLSAEDKLVLDTLSLCLKAHPDERLKIEGYANTVGSAAHNMALSQVRAEAAKAYLVSKGVAAAKLIAVGYGENHLLMPDYNADGSANVKAQAANRRCEVKPAP